MTERREVPDKKVQTKYIGGDAIDVGDFQDTVAAIGRGASVTIHGGAYYYSRKNRLDTLPQNLRTNIQNFLTNYLGTDSLDVPFGGRSDDLDLLEAWRLDSAKRFLLLATPAGRGKSALLARWAQRLSKPDMNLEVAVVFVPVSIRFNTNLPELIFPCVAVQLAELLGKRIPSDYINLAPGFWQNLVGEYLRLALPDGRQLVLIIDGLDEAAWDVGPVLFPMELPPTTKVVVSARYLAGEPEGPKPWLRRLGWSRFDLAEVLSLKKLTRKGVEEAVEQMGVLPNATVVEHEIVEKLYHLTKGDPLLVTLYLEWLLDKKESLGNLNAAELDDFEPDYSGFFRHWWEEQERLWVQQSQRDPLERKRVITLLNILVTAIGPLELADIKALLPGSSKKNVTQAIKPFQRFVLGDGETTSFSFSHARLGDYFRKEFFDEKELKEWQDNFVNWGLRVIGQLQAERNPDFDQVSRYLLQYYSAHLVIAKVATELYLPLLSREWMQSWYHYTDTYVGFLRDVDKVLGQINEVDRLSVLLGERATFLASELLCALCHNSVNSLVDKLPITVLEGLLRHKVWTDEQALFYALHKPSPYDRFGTLLALVPHIRVERQASVYAEAWNAAMEMSYNREFHLAKLAPYLPERVLETVGGIQHAQYRSVVLESLAPYLPEKVYRAALETIDGAYQAAVVAALEEHLPDDQWEDALRRAVETAQELENEYERAHTLSFLGPRLPEAEQKPILEWTLRTAQLDANEERQMQILVGLAPLLPDKVLQVAQTVHHELRRRVVFGALAPYLPEEVFQAIQEFTDELEKTFVLIDLAPYLPEKVLWASQDFELRHRGMVLRALAPYLPEEVYQATKALDGFWEQPSILVSLAPHLPVKDLQAVCMQALEAARTIRSNKNKGLILCELAPYIPLEVYETGLEIVEEGVELAELLAAVAEHLPETKRAAVLMRAFEVAQVIRDWGDQAEFLSNLAQYVSDTERKIFMRRANEIVQQIDDDVERARVLRTIGPNLPETERNVVLLKVVQALLGNKVWVVSERVKAIGYLIGQLPEVDRGEIAHRALKCLMTDDSGYVEPEALAGLVPYLSTPEREVTLSRALDGIRSMGDRGGDWNKSLRTKFVAPHDPEEVYEIAQTLEGPAAKALALASTAPYLGKGKMEDVLEDALEIARTKELHDFERSLILSALAHYLPEEVYRVAHEIEREDNRVQVLKALTPFLPAEVYEMALVAESAENRIELMGALAEYIAKMPSEDMLSTWISNLSALRRLDRSSGLKYISQMMPVIAVLGEEGSLIQTVQAIEDVVYWWP